MIDRTQIDTHLAKWGLELDGVPFATHSSTLVYVTRGSTRGVLKYFDPFDEESDGAEVLRFWQGPAAQVLEADEHAVLLERAMPGTSLAQLVEQGQDEEATDIWCDVVEALHTKPASEGWTTLEERGRSLLNPPRHPQLNDDIVAEARTAWFDLCRTQSSRHVLLHGDLNHFNVLKDDRRGWVVIDPKGDAGELVFETTVFLRNPNSLWNEVAEPELMERRVAQLSRRLNLDATRILRWCAAESVLSSVWSAEGGAKELHALKVARTARLLLSA
jgi:streptomycin 6-kinase